MWRTSVSEVWPLFVSEARCRIQQKGQQPDVRDAVLVRRVLEALARLAGLASVRPGVSVRTALGLTPVLAASDEIDRLVSTRELLGL